MRFALYGMPCAGKTTLLKSLENKIKVINGSSWLNKKSCGNFSVLPEKQKEELRIQYARYISEFSEDNVISDGHYAFEGKVVFTTADAEAYDVFLYLYCDPYELLNRIKVSRKNEKFASISVEALSKWQNFEIEQLRLQCHKYNKDFYVLPYNQITETSFTNFISAILEGFSSYNLAIELVNKIISWYPTPCDLFITDGDKTIINQDSFHECSKGFKTTVFDGDFYTGYQAFCFEKETRTLAFDYEKLKKCTLNKIVASNLKDRDYVVLSAGITSLWERLSTNLSIPNIIASPLISADTKYYVAKLLHSYGYRITAYGDSKNDLYLLREADEGYLYIGEKLSHSIRFEDTSNFHILHKLDKFILDEEKNSDIDSDVAICKSTSGINGSELAKAHFNLGIKMGEYLKNLLPSYNTAVVVLDRGGRFFGDGVYIGFGGKFFPYNPQKDCCPLIKGNLILIVDSVINTGKSILDLIGRLETNNPQAKFCIVSNVIQKEALPKFKDYCVYAVRVSSNKYVGKRQSKQIGNFGPDTADRLFNLIHK